MKLQRHQQECVMLEVAANTRVGPVAGVCCENEFSSVGKHFPGSLRMWEFTWL